MKWILQLFQLSVFNFRLKYREEEPKQSSVLLCMEETEGWERLRWLELRGQCTCEDKTTGQRAEVSRRFPFVFSSVLIRALL